uniref:Uncharacterized protein n=1 Tax=Romanomermis culicivorax TaxID=13658 RepID=A0A915JMP4_ROMCU
MQMWQQDIETLIPHSGRCSSHCCAMRMMRAAMMSLVTLFVITSDGRITAHFFMVSTGALLKCTFET